MVDGVKVVLLGDSGVGKTSIVQRFAFDKFKQDNQSTVGAMFIAKIIDIPEEGVNLKFQIWDTAGQEKYRSLASMYYQDASAAILVYDITQLSTFEGVQTWMKEIKEKAPPDILIVIAANKSDLVEQETVKLEDAKKFAEESNVTLKLTSAKDNVGIADVFKEMAIKIAKQKGLVDQEAINSLKEHNETRGTRLTNKFKKDEQSKKKKCC